MLFTPQAPLRKLWAVSGRDSPRSMWLGKHTQEAFNMASFATTTGVYICKRGRVLTNPACENRIGTKHGGVLGRLRQEDYVFEVSLGFMGKTCLKNRGKGRI